MPVITSDTSTLVFNRGCALRMGQMPLMEKYMPKEIVKNLELADAETASGDRQFSSPLATKPSDISKPAAFVNKGSLTCFVEGVSPQNKSDVLNSTLLAQLAADKKYNRETDVMNWYKYYSEILSNVGWVVSGYNWEEKKASSMSFTMDKAVLEIAAAALTGPEGAVVAATLSALKNLPEKDNRLVLFNHASSSDKAGNFQISTCVEENGTVAMRTMAFYYNSSTSNTDVLFFSYNSASTELTQSTQDQALNSDVYASVRSTIITKLGNNAKNFILEIDI